MARRVAKLLTGQLIPDEEPLVVFPSQSLPDFSVPASANRNGSSSRRWHAVNSAPTDGVREFRPGVADQHPYPVEFTSVVLLCPPMGRQRSSAPCHWARAEARTFS